MGEPLIKKKLANPSYMNACTKHKVVRTSAEIENNNKGVEGVQKVFSL